MASPPAGAVSKGWLRPVGSSGENIRRDGGASADSLGRGWEMAHGYPRLAILLERTAWHKGYAVEAAGALPGPCLFSPEI